MGTIRQTSGQGTALAGFDGRLSPLQARLSLLGRLFSLLTLWQERARQRHALAELDERMLKDIGLTRRAVSSEIVKPFWHA